MVVTLVAFESRGSLLGGFKAEHGATQKTLG